MIIFIFILPFSDSNFLIKFFSDVMPFYQISPNILVECSFMNGATVFVVSHKSYQRLRVFLYFATYHSRDQVWTAI